jgi:competence ComEA-like helix-hairpin-helix protein
MSLYLERKTGQIVELISFHGKDCAQVQTQSGAVVYPLLKDLEEYTPGKGRTGGSPESPMADNSADEDKIPERAIPVDTRLNLNLATAEQIAKHVNGVGFSTAKKIVELRMSLPGEKFQNLEQLKSVPRVDWEQVRLDDLIYVA